MQENDVKAAQDKTQQPGFRSMAQDSTKKAFFKYLCKDAQLGMPIAQTQEVQMSLFDFKETA
jgi:hypothetical protein